MGDQLFRGRAVLVILSLLGVTLLLQLLAAGSDDVNGRTAPPGSTYSTDGEGHKALRLLLEIHGHDVTLVRVGFETTPPNPAATVFVIGGAELSIADQQALGDFVRDGGRLVVSGQPLAIVADAPVTTTRGDAVQHAVTFPIPDLEGVTTVAAPERLVYAGPGPLLPAVGRIQSPAIATRVMGTGFVWALADESILANDALDRDDNAALALAMAGDSERPVVFAEYVHGYEPITGFGSLPGRVQAAVWLGAIAAVLWMFGRSRRLGPAEQRSRPLPPARVAYVNAMAASLERTKDLDSATAPVRDRIRRELKRRGGDDPAGTDRIADQIGIPVEQIERALRSPSDSSDAVAAGTILAKLSKNRT